MTYHYQCVKDTIDKGKTMHDFVKGYSAQQGREFIATCGFTFAIWQHDISPSDILVPNAPTSTTGGITPKETAPISKKASEEQELNNLLPVPKQLMGTNNLAYLIALSQLLSFRQPADDASEIETEKELGHILSCIFQLGVSSAFKYGSYV